MTIHRRMKVADAVLAAIEMLHDRDNCKWSVECYQNGRESGYCLNGYKVATFAENRNSDQIVVYPGEAGDYDMAGNVPRENAWNNRRYFAYDDILGAATFIIEHCSMKKLTL